MALGCLLAAWLTGCASSRQELVPPAAVASDDAPAPWSDGPHQSAATPPRVAGLALPGPWWESLQSPALSALIAQAQAASPTLATAEAALSCEKGKLVARLQQGSEQLSVAGRGELDAAGNYRFEGTLTPGANLSPAFAQGVSYLGPRDSQGAIRLNYVGRF